VTKNDSIDPVIKPAVKQKIMMFPAIGASLASTNPGPIIIQQEVVYPLLNANSDMNRTGHKSLLNTVGSFEPVKLLKKKRGTNIRRAMPA
jgi:hypothetical protein